MSLDVTIKYKEPKKRVVKRGLDGEACGSTLALYLEDGEIEETSWRANITHNMGIMAQNIPVSYNIEGEGHTNNLYALVWRPEEYECNNTDIVAQALQSGIEYMVKHKEELLQYNPQNGWGNYSSFLNWLIAYWTACDENKDCEIICSR